MTTITSREFNRDVSTAEREVGHGPVVTTGRGEPTHVLLSIDEGRRIGTMGAPLVDRLSMDDDIKIEPRRNRATVSPAVSRLMSAISVLEIEVVIGRLTRRDAARAPRLKYWLDNGLFEGFDLWE